MAKFSVAVEPGAAGRSVVQILDEAGIGVEVREFCHVEVLNSDYGDGLEAWKRALAGFTGPRALHGAYADVHPGSPEPEIVAFASRRHRETLRVGHELGCDLMVVHSDYPTRDRVPAKKWVITERLISYYGELARDASELGISIALENVYDTNPYQLTRLCRAVGLPNLGLSLDVGHARLSSSDPLDVWVYELGEDLIHVHLADNDGRLDRHWAIGSGVVQFEPFFEAIGQLKLTPRLTIEATPAAAAWDSLRALATHGWWSAPCEGVERLVERLAGAAEGAR